MKEEQKEPHAHKHRRDLSEQPRRELQPEF